jgi:hypothetical protein
LSRLTPVGEADGRSEGCCGEARAHRPCSSHLNKIEVSAKYTVSQQISLKEQPECRFGMRNPYWGRAHVSHKPNRDAQGCRGIHAFFRAPTAPPRTRAVTRE